MCGSRFRTCTVHLCRWRQRSEYCSFWDTVTLFCLVHEARRITLGVHSIWVPGSGLMLRAHGLGSTAIPSFTSGLTTSGANIKTTQESKESTGRHTSSPSQHSDPLHYPYLVRGVNFRLVLLKRFDRPFVTLSPSLMQRRLSSLRRAAPRQS